MDKKTIYLLLTALALYLVWYFGYVVWLSPDGRLDDFLNNNLALFSTYILQFLGYDTCIEGTKICVNVVATVRVGNGCNGLEIYYIFAAFMFMLPGKWWHKILYTVAGVVVIYLSNLVRIVMLAIDRFKDIRAFHFNHKYTYVFMVYFIVFALWVGWLILTSRKRVVTA